MSTDTVLTYVTAEEYLVAERAATDSRSEWIDGEVRDMVGGTLAHGTIIANIIASFVQQLRNRPFRTNPRDLKVRVPDGPYYYPDVVVPPDPPRFEDGHRDIVLDPILVVEVLSPSTAAIDRGEKLDGYSRIPSVREYLLVDQFEARVDLCVRTDDGWHVRIETDIDAVVELASIDCRLPLVDVYDRILKSDRGPAA